MRSTPLLFLFLALACSNKNESKEAATTEPMEDLVAILDTIWRMEQEPLTLRDSLMKNRFDFEWNLEEQVKRSEVFEEARLNKE